MKIRTLVLASLLTLPLGAVADDTYKQPAPAPTTPTKPVDKPATDKPAAKNKLSQAEIAIVAHLHHVNLMEITMGKQAKLKGTAAVKRYGDMLVRDHSTADKELLAMTKRKGLARIPADKPQNEADKADMKAAMEGMKALKKLKGEDFDRAYLQMMVEGHEKELAKSDPSITIAQDADLKAMLQARKTTLQRHADAARELQKGNAQASIDPKRAPK